MCSERKQQTGNKRGRVIVVSGFSGSGKGTVMSKLTETYPDEYALSVSITTRKPRPGEIDGVHYHFKAQAEFDRLVEQDYFIEYARYVDNSYGTPKPFVDEHLAAGHNVILEIELQGALIAREKYPDAKMIFITAPSADELISRLTGRGTETEATINKRLKRAAEEANGIENYQYIIINETVEETMKKIHEIIQTDENAVPAEADVELIRNIQAELKRRLSI